MGIVQRLGLVMLALVAGGCIDWSGLVPPDASIADLSTDDRPMIDDAALDGAVRDLAIADRAVRDAPIDAAYDAQSDLTPRIVFLLSTLQQGYALGPRSHADSLCTSDWQNLVGPGKKFVALLGYGSIDGGNPSDYVKLTSTNRRIELPNGTLIATDSTFWSETHQAAINRSPEDMLTYTSVWTSFSSSGQALRYADCGNWTSHADMGSAGCPTSSVSWFTCSFKSCEDSYPIYCIEQD